MPRGWRHSTSRTQCLAFPPGQETVGREAIRKVCEQLVANRPHFEIEETLPTVYNGDLALTSTRPSDNTGGRTQVVRRQTGRKLAARDRPPRDSRVRRSEGNAQAYTLTGRRCAIEAHEPPVRQIKAAGGLGVWVTGESWPVSGGDRVGWRLCHLPDRFKPYAPDVQAVVRLEEALPPEHPIHVFVDLVQGVDLRHFVIPPGPKGEKPYHPHALFGILAWGYLHGVRSARKLARLARQEATFVYLAGGGRAELSDAGAVPAGERGGVHGGVPGDGDPGAAAGAGAAGPRGAGRDQAEGEHVEAQGDELRADAAAGGPAQGGDRAAGGAGRDPGRGRGSGVRGRLGRLLGGRGAGAAGGPAGEDPGGPRAPGGGAARRAGAAGGCGPRDRRQGAAVVRGRPMPGSC